MDLVMDIVTEFVLFMFLLDQIDIVFVIFLSDITF